ncbi:unnamed protein product [Phytomonas sp. EM1]|nr:unnamed protein product [Phytomonas sp. EM1]|eukprot:CCW63614.1 unnamed protein product [Phytomonas sp. isolate EM1]
MAPKKKEEEREFCAGSFTFQDGSVYEGHYIKKDTSTDLTQQVSGSRLSATAASKLNTSTHSLERGTSAPTVIPQGLGIFRDCSGAIYDGQWLDGKMYGTGTLTFPSGCYYKGEFLANHYNGVGKYAWPDGSYYKGEWRQGMMHGSGMYMDASGRCWHGVFTDGVCTSAVAEQVF